MNLNDALGFVPGELQDVAGSDESDNLLGEFGNGQEDLPGKISANVTAPAQLWASKLKLNSGAMAIYSGSTVSASGLGGQFVNPPYGMTDREGGSHLGYGGVATDAAVADLFDPGQRHATYDNPFDPTKPGDGGFGANGGGGLGQADYCYGCGDSGGGVIAINATSLTEDGTISSDGDAAGDPYSGGAGAGGAINVNTGVLSGDGTISANGASVDFLGVEKAGGGTGALCCTGQGGGGAVALHYTSDSGFQATTTAFGGLTDDAADNPNRDLGGAGTVFLQQVASAPAAPSAPSAPSSGNGSGDGSGHGSGHGRDIRSAHVARSAHTPRQAAVRPRVSSAPRIGSRPPAFSGVAARAGSGSSTAALSTLGGLELSTKLFTAGAGGGTTISYRDSAAGTAHLTVRLTTAGARAGRHCEKVTSATADDKPCVIVGKQVGSFTHKDKKGENHFTFTGKVGSKTLVPDSYELEATAGKPGTVQISEPFDVLVGTTVTPPAATGTSGGTLIIDGGANSDYPVPDDTPLPSSWSSPTCDCNSGLN